MPLVLKRKSDILFKWFHRPSFHLRPTKLGTHVVSHPVFGHFIVHRNDPGLTYLETSYQQRFLVFKLTITTPT
jgi:hypothetical protein